MRRDAHGSRELAEDSMARGQFSEGARVVRQERTPRRKAGESRRCAPVNEHRSAETLCLSFRLSVFFISSPSTPVCVFACAYAAI